VAGEVEGEDVDIPTPFGQAAGERGEVARAAEKAVQQDERTGSGAGALVGEDGQEASRIPERCSHSSWARSEAPWIRDKLPQYRQWMNAGSISTNRLPHL
jgi:hypothetical protein